MIRVGLQIDTFDQSQVLCTKVVLNIFAPPPGMKFISGLIMVTTC